MDHNRADQTAFEPVLQDLRSANEYRLRTGNSVSLVEPYAYDILLNRDTQTKDRGAFLSIITIITALAGVFAYEKHTNMDPMIMAAYRGRKDKLIVKPSLIIIVSFVCPIVFSFVQIYLIDKGMPFPDLDKPVQGLRYLNDFGMYISIRTFIAFILIVRGLFGMVIGGFTALLSYLGNDKFSVISWMVIVVLIWVFVTELIPGLSFLNPIKLLGYSWV